MNIWNGIYSDFTNDSRSANGFTHPKWVEKSIRTTGIQYVHDKQIGGPNEKRGTENRSQKEQRWKVPVDLLEEIVEQAEVSCDQKKKKYIIDLFAGQG